MKENMNTHNKNNTPIKEGNTPSQKQNETVKMQAENKPQPCVDYPTSAPQKDKTSYDKSLVGVIISYCVCFVIAAGLALIIANSGGVFSGNIPKRKLYGVISDSFLVPGVLFCGVGGLVKVAENGFFDGVSFVLKRAFLSLIPGGRIKKEANYQEFKKEKEEKRKHLKYSSIFFVGLFFILLSIVFLLLYSNVKV